MTSLGDGPTIGAIIARMWRNPLILVVDLLFGVLVVSCLLNGSNRAALYTAAFLVMLKLAFLGFSLLLERFPRLLPTTFAGGLDPDQDHNRLALRKIGLALIAIGSLPVIGLFFRIGFIPGLDAVWVLDYDLLVLLRSTAFDATKGVHLYLMEYGLRAMLPIGVFALLLSGGWLVVPALVWSTLLAAGVMAKLYPILLVAPLILYCCFAQRYLLSGLFTVYLLLVLSIQITTTNPALKLPMLVVFDKATRDFVLAKAQHAEAARPAENSAAHNAATASPAAESPPAASPPAAKPPSAEQPAALPADEATRAKLQAIGSEARGAAAPVQAIDPATERQAVLLAERAAVAERTPEAGATTANRSILTDLWNRIDAVGGGVGRALYKSLEAIYIRLVLLPGEVMGQWFETIPWKQPYFGVCGYRVLALALGCEYVHPPRRVFEIVYAETYVKRGIIGNLNAPGFLMDYANLGLLGVMLSAGLLGLIIAAFSGIFAGKSAFLAVLVPYFALTTEAPISLILNSGGLGVATIILLLMRRQLMAVDPHTAGSRG